MKVSVIGLGYIGLPTAAVFAHRGFDVIGVDKNPRVLETLDRGEAHFREPELDILVSSAINSGKLLTSTTPQPADAFIIAVPTPVDFRNERPVPDMSFTWAALREIAPVLTQGNLVVIESTLEVGATDKAAKLLADLRPDLMMPGNTPGCPDIFIAHCPERVLPGNIIHELVENDRIIGGVSSFCTERAIELYAKIVSGGFSATTAKVAEITKLAENSFRDVNIAFANELSMICQDLGVDVRELIALANHHPRVSILSPGPGVGGHCIAVDPWFLVDASPHFARLIRTAREVNDEKKNWSLMQIRAAVSGYLQAKAGIAENNLTLAFYGVAFKPDVDDFRESPSLDIVARMASEFEGRIQVVEPNADALPGALSGLENVPLETALATADMHFVLVAHKDFKTSKELAKTVTIDFCGACSRH